MDETENTYHYVTAKPVFTSAISEIPVPLTEGPGDTIYVYSRISSNRAGYLQVHLSYRGQQLSVAGKHRCIYRQIYSHVIDPNLIASLFLFFLISSARTESSMHFADKESVNREFTVNDKSGNMARQLDDKETTSSLRDRLRHS